MTQQSILKELKTYAYWQIFRGEFLITKKTENNLKVHEPKNGFLNMIDVY